MYLSTYEERESGSMYEEAYEGNTLSKLNLCDEGKEGSCVAVTGTHSQARLGGRGTSGTLLLVSGRVKTGRSKI